MKPTLLVLDDEPGVLDMIRSHFELRGFDVHTARDGREGIEACSSVCPDVIVLDLKMKVMDGDEAIPHLRALAPDAKIFVVSAFQDDLLERRLRGLAVDGVFEKPVSILELQTRILMAVRSSGREPAPRNEPAASHC